MKVEKKILKEKKIKTLWKEYEKNKSQGISLNKLKEKSSKNFK